LLCRGFSITLRPHSAAGPPIGLPANINRRMAMAKGQQRGTREKKKPKQTKVKPAPAVSRFAAAPVQGDAAAGKKKW
jgi:hypothetical protein